MADPGENLSENVIEKTRAQHVLYYAFISQVLQTAENEMTEKKNQNNKDSKFSLRHLSKHTLNILCIVFFKFLLQRRYFLRFTNFKTGR